MRTTAEPTTVKLSFLGVCVAVHVGGEALARLVRNLFGELLAENGDTAPVATYGLFGEVSHITLSGANGIVAGPGRWIDLAPWLSWELNQIAVRCSAPDLALHAGAVQGPSGAVVIAGASGAGKSTSVASLLTAGWDYLTDELVVVGEDGRLRPYTRPIGLRPGGVRAMRSLGHELSGVTETAGDVLVPVQQLGRTARMPATPAAIVLPEHDSTTPPRLRRLSARDAFAALLGHTFHAGRDTGRVLEGLAALVSRVPCYHLRVPGASAVVRAVEEAVR